jgi:serine/threonine protein kinase
MFGTGSAKCKRSLQAVSSRQISHKKIEDDAVIYKKYELGRKLGQGSFGVVYEITNKETDEKFAIKIISKEKVGGGKYAVSFENEVFIMKSVIHPNLIKLEEVFESKKVTTSMAKHTDANYLINSINLCRNST